MFLGLRTIIYPSPDLAAAKAWFTALLGFEPTFDEPFSVGYSVGGYELPLDPNGSVDDGPVTYRGVPDCDEAWQRLLDAGASPREPVRDVGDSIGVATVVEPSGNSLASSRTRTFSPPTISLSRSGTVIELAPPHVDTNVLEVTTCAKSVSESSRRL